MSTLDIYRNNVKRKRDEIANLSRQKANESTKLANLSSKISSASAAMSRTTSASTINSKLREVERYRNEQATIEKRISDYEMKLSRKHDELNREEQRLSKEEENVQKKIASESLRRLKESQQQISNLSNTLSRHDSLHRQTLAKIETLQKLPAKITVLFLASNPVDQQQLRLDEEARSIGEMIRKAKHRDSVIFESRWAVRPLDILQAINELDPTVIHFSGHGSDTDEIIFQREDGSAITVSKEAIVQTIAASSENVRLVFFNTCYSKTQASTIAGYVPASIGMSTSIGDEAARIFAAQFYSSIGFGLSLKKAFDQAKAALMLQGIGEFETPELFVSEGLNSDEIFLVSLEA